MAAALAEMVARFADDSEAATTANAYRAELLVAGDRELSSYEPVLEASRLPQSDPSRAERLDATLSAASEAPLAITRASTGVAELAADMAARSKHALAGDAIAAVLLAEASASAAARLVEMNLAKRPSDMRLAAVKELVQRAGAARGAALGRG